MALQLFVGSTLILTPGVAIAFYFATAGELPSKYYYMMAVAFGYVTSDYPKDNLNTGLHQKKAM